MSNSSTEVPTKNFDVGEGIGVNPASVSAEGAHRDKTENSASIVRPSRQERLPADLSLENFNAGNGGKMVLC